MSGPDISDIPDISAGPARAFEFPDISAPASDASPTPNPEPRNPNKQSTEAGKHANPSVSPSLHLSVSSQNPPQSPAASRPHVNR
jgi:hypothetical protein